MTSLSPVYGCVELTIVLASNSTLGLLDCSHYGTRKSSTS